MGKISTKIMRSGAIWSQIFQMKTTLLNKISEFGNTLTGNSLFIAHLIYRHLLVDREFVVVSHLKIFPLQLLGPANKPMAGPSSSKGKILR